MRLNTIFKAIIRGLMNKKLVTPLVILLCSLVTSLFASDIDEYYKKYKNTILCESFFTKDGYFFVAGSAKIRSSSASSLTLARNMALATLERNIAKCRVQSSSFNGSGINSPSLRQKVTEAWISISNNKYIANNRIDLESFSKNGNFYHVAAYKVSDIVFEDKTPITWTRIYNDFKNNPGKRNELLFFEIIPEKELPSLKQVLENNITKQYGKNFALMFAGKDVPAITKEKYDRLKKNSEKYNSKTPLNILVIAANSLPYDKNICTLLAEKFDSMQMPRCASVMRKRATESNKLVVEIPPPPVVKAKPAVEEKNKVDAEPQKEQQEDKSTFQQILEFLNIVDSEPPRKTKKSVPPMTEEKTQAVKVEPVKVEEKQPAVKVEPVKVEEKQQAVNPEFFSVKEKPQAGKSNAPAAETNSGKKTKTTKPKQPASDVDFTNLL